MKQIKKVWIIFSLCFIFTVTMESIPLNNKELRINAASVKLNKTSITLSAGRTRNLKITGTTKKVTWSSSNKKIAKVSKSGKVTGVKQGTATITATVSGKSYSCKVNVTKAKKLTYKEAENIAINRTGGGIVTDMELDYEQGVLVYEGEVYYEGTEYDIYIDAYTGKVILFKIDY